MTVSYFTKKYCLAFWLLCTTLVHAQKLDVVTTYDAKKDTLVTVVWSAGNGSAGALMLDLDNNRPLFKSIEYTSKNFNKIIAQNLDPAFILTVGKRDLVSQNGWNIFFDKVPNKPFQ